MKAFRFSNFMCEIEELEIEKLSYDQVCIIIQELDKEKKLIAYSLEAAISSETERVQSPKSPAYTYRSCNCKRNWTSSIAEKPCIAYTYHRRSKVQRTNEDTKGTDPQGNTARDQRAASEKSCAFLPSCCWEKDER